MTLIEDARRGICNWSFLVSLCESRLLDSEIERTTVKRWHSRPGSDGFDETVAVDLGGIAAAKAEAVFESPFRVTANARDVLDPPNRFIGTVRFDLM